MGGWTVRVVLNCATATEGIIYPYDARLQPRRVACCLRQY